MNIKSKEKTQNNTVELIIEVGHEEFEAAVEKIYRKQRGSINVAGFRKGKAPRKIIEAMYGTGLFYEDAINDVYPVAYAEAIEKEKLDAVAYPDVEVISVGKEGLTFKAIVTTKPAVKLGAYEGLTAPKDEIKVTAADVDAELKPMIERATRLVSVDRKAKKGDTAVIDFEGFLEGVPFEGGKGDAFSLELGSNSFVPGFEDGVIGMKSGDEKDINLTFPKDYTPELADKAVVFKVKVNEIKEHVAPTLDDEFAKDVSEFETLADLKKNLKKQITDRREKQQKNEFERSLMDQLIDNMEADIPEAMIEYRIDKIVDDYAMRISSQGMKLEDYLSMMGMTMQDLRGQAREGAVRQVQSELALEAVAAAEKMKVTAKDTDKEYQKLADEYSMELDKVKAAVPAKDMEHDVLLQKATDFIIEKAKIGKAPARKVQAEKKPAAAKKAPVKADGKATVTKKAPAKKVEADAPAEKKPAAAKKPAAKKETAPKAEKAPAAKKPAKKAEK
ncbi:MAG: trigger factor [Oscillospiraceae bacterium]